MFKKFCLLTSSVFAQTTLLEGLIYSYKSLQDVDLSDHNIQEMLTMPPDTFKTFEEIVLENGLMVESHWVTTEDGFINLMHRVYKDSPYKDVFWCGPLKEGQDPNRKFAKPVIYMQHGIADSSDTWIMNVKEKAPAFVAAEQGYDVWIGNARGNKYSHFHKKFNAETDPQYWQNSFTDIAKYDIPAFFSHIKNTVNLQEGQKISVVAHSQGTTDFFYGMATNPKYYSENVNLMIGLGPIAKLSKPSRMEIFVMELIEILEPILLRFGVYDFMSVKQTKLPLQNICGYFTGVCEFFVHFVCTTNSQPLEYDRFRVYFGHYPAGSGLQSFKHFIQMVKTHKFAEYDYGKQKNMKVYGQPTPPEIDVKKVRDAGVPIGLYVGVNDLIVDPVDSHWVRDEIGKETIVDYKEMPGGHLQFFVGKDASYFTKNAMNLLKKYNPIMA